MTKLCVLQVACCISICMRLNASARRIGLSIDYGVLRTARQETLAVIVTIIILHGKKQKKKKRTLDYE